MLYKTLIGVFITPAELKVSITTRHGAAQVCLFCLLLIKLSPVLPAALELVGLFIRGRHLNLGKESLIKNLQCLVGKLV